MRYSKILTAIAVVLALSSVPAYAQRGGGHGGGGGGRGGGGARAAGGARAGGGMSRGTAVPRGGYGGPHGGYGGHGYYGNRGYYGGYYGGYYPGYWGGYGYGPWFGFGFGWDPYDWGYPYAWGGYPYPYSYPYPYPYQYPTYGYPYAQAPSTAYPPAGYEQPGQTPNDPYGAYGQSGTVSATPGAAPGGVSFDVTPSTAGIYIDGRYLGTAAQFGSKAQPLSIPSGHHQVEFQADGFRPMTFDMNVEAGHVTPFRAQLQPSVNR